MGIDWKVVQFIVGVLGILFFGVPLLAVLWVKWLTFLGVGPDGRE